MPRLTRRLAVKSNFLIMSKPAWLIFLLIPMSSIPANGIKCENEGPCGVDRYCSKPDTNRDTCRDCEDIAKHYCHDRDSVLQKFPSCDGYCFKRQLNRLTQDLQERDNLIRNQSQQIDHLVNNSVASSPSTSADGVQFDWVHYLLFGLFAVAMVWAGVATFLLTKRKTKKVPADRRCSHELEQLVPQENAGTVTPTSVVVEEGYETGEADSATSTPRQTRVPTAPPADQLGPAHATPRPRVQSTDKGQDVNNPTTEDTGPLKLAL